MDIGFEDPNELESNEIYYDDKIINTDMMMEIIQTLNPKQKEVMNYRSQGLQYNEIAKLMDITLGNVRSVVFNAKKIIRKKMDLLIRYQEK